MVPPSLFTPQSGLHFLFPILFPDPVGLCWASRTLKQLDRSVSTMQSSEEEDKLEARAKRLWVALGMGSSDDEALPSSKRARLSSAVYNHTPPALAVDAGDDGQALPAIAVDDGGEGQALPAIAVHAEQALPAIAVDEGQALPAVAVKLVYVGDGEYVVVDKNHQGEVAAPTSTSYTSSPLRYWSNRIGDRMVQAVRDVEGFGRCVQWHLPPSLDSCLIQSAIIHIDNVLLRCAVQEFYIGITHVVGSRWANQHVHDWQRQHLVAVSEDSWEIAYAEEMVIAQFRYWRRGGSLVGLREVNGETIVGNPLCQNKNRGGETAHHGTPPHVLYVCWNFYRG